MPVTNNPFSTSELAESLYNNLLGKDLIFFLGQTENTEENTINSYSDVSNIGYGESIRANDIWKVLEVPGYSRWQTGKGTSARIGQYTSGTYGKNVDVNNQYFFVGKSLSGPDMLYFVTGFPGIKNRRDLMGSIVPHNLLGQERSDGRIATNNDGISYAAVMALPALEEMQFSTRFIPITQAKDIRNELDYYSSADKLSEATNICGPGHERRCGTCCLYHTESYFDSVEGITFSSGDLYKCVETKCYRCIELAKDLSKKYIFNKHKTDTTGPTGGTGAGCWGCSDTENYPNECGPCPCTIDWNDKSYYQSIMNNKNIPVISPADINARLDDVGRTHLSGAISCATIDLGGLNEAQKQVSDGYKNRDLLLPIIGDGNIPAQIRCSTVTDSNGNIILTGIEQPSNHGYEYTYANINKEEWARMFPGVPADRIIINLIPLGGFHSMLHKILPLRVMIKKTIKKGRIKNTTPQTAFNRFGFGEFYTKVAGEESKRNILSGSAKNAEASFNFNTKIHIEDTSGAPAGPLSESMVFDPIKDIVLPGAGLGEQPSGSGFGDNIITSSAVSGTKTEVFISTSKPEYYAVGKRIKDSDLNEYSIVLSEPPKVNDKNVNLMESNIMHRSECSVNIDDRRSAISETYNFEIILGSENPNK